MAKAPNAAFDPKAYLNSLDAASRLPPEAIERFNALTKGLPPLEASRRMLCEFTAHLVNTKNREELGGKHPDLPLLDGENVVEVLEEMVEGDVVLDDAATHKWFRDTLDKHREMEATLERDWPQMVAANLGYTIGSAFKYYDVLVDLSYDPETKKPEGIVLMANAKGRAALKGFEFQAVMPPDVAEEFPDWLGVTFSPKDAEPEAQQEFEANPNAKLRFIAEAVARELQRSPSPKRRKLRVGMLAPLDPAYPLETLSLSPVTAKAA